ncbi:MAG TPA: hemolysin D [Thermoanaerobaculia bacterium]|nr:hemolysin D [Thermoanaerobaculia bacterium]
MKTLPSRNLKRPLSALLAVVVFLLPLAAPPQVNAFTQSGVATFIGNGVPMGHEWLTRRAAIELLLGPNNDPVVPKDPKDPRWNPTTWTQGMAKNLDLSQAQSEVKRIKGLPYSDSRYASTYKPIFDSIIGERWVDLGGFNVTTSNIGSYNCFDAVAQEPVEVQYDHFMRQYNDSGNGGGVNAATQSQKRFVQYFVAAAMAPPTQILVWDGGGYAAQYTVDRNYFLMGRAAHLFQDSFSLEHTVRLPADNYTTVKQVKSYLCALGSEQHSHATPSNFNYASGDVIWNVGTATSGGWSNYIPSNQKTSTLVAMEAMKDMWAAFIRTMATPVDQRQNKATSEAQTLVNNWLSFDPNSMGSWYSNTTNRDATYVLNLNEPPPGVSQTACMQALAGVPNQGDYVGNLEHQQKVCLFNLQPVPGYGDLADTSMHMPFNWQWINYVTWSTPPSNWTIPPLLADTGSRVNLRSVKTGNSMTGKVGADQYVNVNSGTNLNFIQVATPDKTGYYFRSANDPTLFLSYTAVAGQVKLWQGTTNSSYTLPAAGGNTAIMNQYYKQYMWVDSKGNVYLSSTGDPTKNTAQWTVKQNAF